jgi:hypothetical protein
VGAWKKKAGGCHAVNASTKAPTSPTAAIGRLPPNTLVFPAAGIDLEEIRRQPDDVTSSFRKHAREHRFHGVHIHDIRTGTRPHRWTATCRSKPSRPGASMIRYVAALIRQAKQKSDTRAAGIIGGIPGRVLR